MNPRMTERHTHDRAAAIWLHENPAGLGICTKTPISGFSVILIGSCHDPVAGPARARGATGPPRAPSGVRAGSARCRDPWCAGSLRYRHPPPCGAPPGSRSEEHTSELQSLMRISYAVFCLNKKKQYTDVTFIFNHIIKLTQPHLQLNSYIT